MTKFEKGKTYYGMERNIRVYAKVAGTTIKTVTFKLLGTQNNADSYSPYQIDEVIVDRNQKRNIYFDARNESEYSEVATYIPDGWLGGKTYCTSIVIRAKDEVELETAAEEVVNNNDKAAAQEVVEVTEQTAKATAYDFSIASLYVKSEVINGKVYWYGDNSDNLSTRFEKTSRGCGRRSKTVGNPWKRISKAAATEILAKYSITIEQFRAYENGEHETAAQEVVNSEAQETVDTAAEVSESAPKTVEQAKSTIEFCEYAFRNMDLSDEAFDKCLAEYKAAKTVIDNAAKIAELKAEHDKVTEKMYADETSEATARRLREIREEIKALETEQEVTEPELTANMKLAEEIIASVGESEVKFSHAGIGKNGGLALHYDLDDGSEFGTGISLVEVFTDKDGYILDHVNVIKLNPEKTVTTYNFIQPVDPAPTDEPTGTTDENVETEEQEAGEYKPQTEPEMFKAVMDAPQIHAEIFTTSLDFAIERARIFLVNNAASKVKILDANGKALVEKTCDQISRGLGDADEKSTEPALEPTDTSSLKKMYAEINSKYYTAINLPHALQKHVDTDALYSLRETLEEAMNSVQTEPPKPSTVTEAGEPIVEPVDEFTVELAARKAAHETAHANADKATEAVIAAMRALRDAQEAEQKAKEAENHARAEYEGYGERKAGELRDRLITDDVINATIGGKSLNQLWIGFWKGKFQICDDQMELGNCDTPAQVENYIAWLKTNIDPPDEPQAIADDLNAFYTAHVADTHYKITAINPHYGKNQPAVYWKIIYSKSEKRFFITSASAYPPHGVDEICAGYDTLEQVRIVVEKLKSAIDRNAMEFDFPTVEELNAPPESPATFKVGEIYRADWRKADDTLANFKILTRTDKFVTVVPVAFAEWGETATDNGYVFRTKIYSDRRGEYFNRDDAKVSAGGAAC